MRIHLYYVDKNWQKRWYARNCNLLVDYTKKAYETRITPFYWYEWMEHVEVNKKSDILDYEKMLKNNWFTETKF